MSHTFLQSYRRVGIIHCKCWQSLCQGNRLKSYGMIGHHPIGCVALLKSYKKSHSPSRMKPEEVSSEERSSCSENWLVSPLGRLSRNSRLKSADAGGVAVFWALALLLLNGCCCWFCGAIGPLADIDWDMCMFMDICNQSQFHTLHKHTSNWIIPPTWK